MSVSDECFLPGQPAGTGTAQFIALGGDGKVAPLGCWVVEFELAGDAGGGTASVNLTMDPRYTNVLAIANFVARSSAAAADFYWTLQDRLSNVQGIWEICGTAPHISSFQTTSAFLWYPPPLLFSGSGFIQGITANIDATETYVWTYQIYVFDIDVRRLLPLPYIMQNFPGVSAPAAI